MARDEEFLAFADAASARLLRIATLITRHQQDAEDAVQTTLERVYAGWGKVSRADDPFAYARTIMVRLVIDDRRRFFRSRTTLAGDALPESDAVTSPDVEGRLVLHAALAQLPSRTRAAVVLRYLDDLSVAETAAAMDVSEGTVKRQCSDGIARLRTLLPQGVAR